MGEAVTLAHIVKYADERLAGLEGVMAEDAATVIEVQTLGELGLRYRHRRSLQLRSNIKTTMCFRFLSPLVMAFSSSAVLLRLAFFQFLLRLCKSPGEPLNRLQSTFP